MVEHQRLEQRTNFNIEMILELGYCTAKNYSLYLSSRNAGEPPPSALMDCLPEMQLLIIDESYVAVPQLSSMYRGEGSYAQRNSR